MRANVYCGNLLWQSSLTLPAPVGAKLFHLYILDRFYEKMVFERVVDKCSGR